MESLDQGSATSIDAVREGGASAGGLVGIYAARGLERGVDLRFVLTAHRLAIEGLAGWPEVGRGTPPPTDCSRPLAIGRGTTEHRRAVLAERRGEAGDGRRRMPAGRGRVFGGFAPLASASPRRRLATAGLVALLALAGLAGGVFADEGVRTPGQARAVAAPARAQRYVVRAGDTLEGLAETFGVEPAAIAAASALTDLTPLARDQVLVIPPPGLAPDEVAELPLDERTIPFVVGAHLVAKGETLADIAAEAGIDATTLAAFNGLDEPDLLRIDQRLLIPAAVGGSSALPVAPAMLEGTLAPLPLAAVDAVAYGVGARSLPSAATEIAWATAPIATSAPATVFVPNVPTHVQERNLSCEYAAAYIATSAFGAGIPESVFLDQVPGAENPHLGFRGDIDGAWGNTDDYGVYADALVPVLTAYGFAADAFYGLGEGAALRRRLDAGVPVIVWLGYWGDTRERLVDDAGRPFSLAAGVHVVVAYGYDENGVHLSNPANGAYEYAPWPEFEAMWGVLDGMGLAVSSVPA